MFICHDLRVHFERLLGQEGVGKKVDRQSMG